MPIQQTLFYYTEDEYKPSRNSAKSVLIFARPCINAQHIQDEIYAGNGGYTDFYYERMRSLVTFAMMECNGGDDTCFCVSMGSNETELCPGSPVFREAEPMSGSKMLRSIHILTICRKAATHLLL